MHSPLRLYHHFHNILFLAVIGKVLLWRECADMWHICRQLYNLSPWELVTKWNAALKSVSIITVQKPKDVISLHFPYEMVGLILLYFEGNWGSWNNRAINATQITLMFLGMAPTTSAGAPKIPEVLAFIRPESEKIHINLFQREGKKCFHSSRGINQRPCIHSITESDRILRLIETAHSRVSSG